MGKHQQPAPIVVFLGIVEDASRVDDSDVLYLYAKEERRLSLLEEVRLAIKEKACLPSHAAHLVGRLLHYAGALPGRTGYGQLAPLSDHSVGDRKRLTSEAIAALQFHEEMLRVPRSRAVPLSPEGCPCISVISDASWEPREGSDLLGRICFLILHPIPWLRKGGVIDIVRDSPLLRSLEGRKTQIMAAELLGPVCALAFGGGLLSKKSVSFFIDNISGMCALVKGGSRRADLAAIASSVALGLAQFDIPAWFDYVESESNSADGGSRVGAGCELAARLGVKLEQLELPPLPADSPLSPPSAWAAWWRERLRATYPLS